MKKFSVFVTILSVAFVLVLVFSTPTQAYFGAKVGLFLPSSSEFSTGPALEFFAGHEIKPQVSLEAGVGYRYADPSSDSGTTYTLGIVPVTVTVKMKLPLSEAFSGYGGAGVGLYLTQLGYQGEYHGGNPDATATALGFHLVGGLQARFSKRVAALVEATWFTAKPEFDSDYSSRSVDIGGFMLNAGIKF